MPYATLENLLTNQLGLSYRPVARVDGMRIGRDEVLAVLGKPGTIILDGRSPEEYRGERIAENGRYTQVARGRGGASEFSFGIEESFGCS